jgi:hypothetical protein
MLSRDLPLAGGERTSFDGRATLQKCQNQNVILVNRQMTKAS